MSERKIIQIAVTALPGYPDFLYALCDDGTVWTCKVGAGPWEPIEAVPDGVKTEDQDPQ